MDNGKEGILLVVDNNDCLIGIITDGDIRREIISSGPNSSSSAKKIMSSNPIISKSDNSTYWQEIFNQNDIEHLPICDDSNKVIKLVRLSNYSKESNKKIYRISQAYLPGNYGAFVSINEILNISKNKYYEKKIKKILPSYQKNIRGIHTLNYVKNFTVFDDSKWTK